MEGWMERLGWDISLVEVVDVYVYMYVLVMTTVIYNSPHILSHRYFFFFFLCRLESIPRSVTSPGAHIFNFFLQI